MSSLTSTLAAGGGGAAERDLDSVTATVFEADCDGSSFVAGMGRGAGPAEAKALASFETEIGIAGGSGAWSRSVEGVAATGIGAAVGVARTDIWMGSSALFSRLHSSEESLEELSVRLLLLWSLSLREVGVFLEGLLVRRGCRGVENKASASDLDASVEVGVSAVDVFSAKKDAPPAATAEGSRAPSLEQSSCNSDDNCAIPADFSLDLDREKEISRDLDRSIERERTIGLALPCNSAELAFKEESTPHASGAMESRCKGFSLPE